MRFDKDFLIGTASASYQVEGNNSGSDTWVMEHLKYGGYPELSGDACDHYHTYRQDIANMAEAGIGAYRFSLEWSRIEPQDGVFNEKEMFHYLDVIHACREYHLEPMVTLFHFTSPIWLIAKGGWEADSAAEDFEKYACYVFEHLKEEHLRYLCTINEANIGALISGYIRKMQASKNAGQLQMGIDLKQAEGEAQERKQEFLDAFGVEEPAVFTSPRSAHGMEIIFRAHRAAVAAARRILPEVKTGLSLSLRDLQSVPGGEENRNRQWQEDFLMYLPVIEHDDFFGVQNYTRAIFNADGEMNPAADAELTQMKYEYYPEGLEHVIRAVAEFYHGEIVVTENGIATADDARRCDFIRTALTGVQRCIADGIPVRGYCYWSMIDNYEWQSGYQMQFGVMSCDRSKQLHENKPSMYLLGGYSERSR